MLVLSGLFVSGSEILIPKMIQHFIDVIYPAKDYTAFGYLLLAIAGLCVVMFVAAMAQNTLQRVIREKAARDLQVAVFQKLRKLGFSYYERHPVGETLSFLNTEVAAIQEIYRQYLPGIIQDAIFAVVAVSILFTIDVKLTLLLIPCFLLYYLVGPYYEKKAAKVGKMTADNRVQFNKQIYESISALPEFRAYGRESWDLQRVLERLNLLVKNNLRVILYAYLRGTVRRLCTYSGAIAVFLYGAYLIKHDQLSVGGFVAFTILYFFAIFKMTVVITNLTEQRLLMFQGEILYHFMHQKPDVQEVPQPVLAEIRGRIEFNEVHFGYPSRPDVIRGFTLDIRAGEKIALVGTSGNGKSTILKLAARFYDPLSGEIKLDGVPLNQLALEQIHDAMGYVFQETYLFGTTVRDNIRFGRPDASDEQLYAAAEAAYAHEFILQLPEGYETIVGERGVKLSGGQKQRISLARLFLKNPAIVLLDEATSALDNQSERKVQLALDHLLKNRTTITVAHRLSTIRKADRIIVMDQGCIAEAGTYDALMAMQGLFYRLSEGLELAGEEEEVS
ncbi:ABC transporter ATP-binding protein [Paenibacillus psychroresistens]|uniref:ABC transporter ATP-binding protein n=1 Tax=Paenibacillus psychroresistens TaxID=1778678 RepID=A0A6B8RKC4_9BACL|nr:ABC transporter ATP-binding protein [Paenibacillus psychroresistens]QGQ95808.1 ABC transporter ATP-binding protein [Paenibacillus psychroresistens]